MCVWVPFYPGRSVCVCLYPGRRFASLIRVPGYPSPLFYPSPLSESLARPGPPAAPSAVRALYPSPLSESIIRVLFQSSLSESLSECHNEFLYPSPLSEFLARVNCFSFLSESLFDPHPLSESLSESFIRVPCALVPVCGSESLSESLSESGAHPCRACVRARTRARARGARACVRAGACLLGRTGLASYPSLLSESLIRVL